MSDSDQEKTILSQLEKKGLVVDDQGKLYPLRHMGTEFSSVAQLGLLCGIISVIAVLLMAKSGTFVNPIPPFALVTISLIYLTNYYMRIWREDKKHKQLIAENEHLAQELQKIRETNSAKK